MKKILLTLILFLGLNNIYAQKIDFIEYDLENGLHVILHKDNSAPVISTSVMYLVGSKEEKEGRTGFAHFFEQVRQEHPDLLRAAGRQYLRQRARTRVGGGRRLEVGQRVRA